MSIRYKRLFLSAGSSDRAFTRSQVVNSLSVLQELGFTIVFKLFQVSWRLNFTWIMSLSIATLPGIIVSIVTGQSSWLIASFLAVCSILPYTISHKSRVFALANTFLIFTLIYLLITLLKLDWYYSLIAISILAVIVGTIDNANKDFRAFTTWFVIGIVYGAEKLMSYHLNVEQSFLLFALTLFSILISTFFNSEEFVSRRFNWVSMSDKRFIYNFKYLLPSVITILICYYFKIKEPQWMFWSSLSVVYPDFESTVLKMKHRFFGVLIGAFSGLLVGLLLPSSDIISYFCFFMIMLSFRMFEDYFPGFLVRCFFIVLYAGNYSTEIALIRLSNVFIGGIIGVLCTFFLVKIYQLKST